MKARLVNEHLDEGLDTVINRTLFKNRDYLMKIDNLLNTGTNDEIVDFCKDLLKNTPYPHSGKLELLRHEANNNIDRADPKDLLTQLKYYLKRTHLKNIRIYGPNHGLGSWLVTDRSLSFSS